MQGVDAAQNLGPYAGRLKAAGIGFVCCYYAYTEAKCLTADAARTLTAAGLAIVTVFEARGDRYDNFTAEQGGQDALRALQLAERCGQPGGSGIYFAVDYDASADELGRGITAYFEAVRTGIGGRYRIGAYGSGLTCSVLGGAGLAELFWLGGAMGWQGSRGFTGAHIRQGATDSILGLQVDPDTADGDFGQWMVAGVPPLAASQDWPAAFRGWQSLLQAAGFYHGALDGNPGPMTYSAMHAAYRASAG